MPYISEEMRNRNKNGYSIDSAVDELLETISRHFEDNELDGVVNYCFSRILADVFRLPYPRYSKIARAIGALECVKQELYRRIASPYEDLAKEKNGDIHEYKMFGS